MPTNSAALIHWVDTQKIKLHKTKRLHIQNFTWRRRNQFYSAYVMEKRGGTGQRGGQTDSRVCDLCVLEAVVCVKREGSGQVNGLANALGIFSVSWHACSHTYTHTLVFDSCMRVRCTSVRVSFVCAWQVYCGGWQRSSHSSKGAVFSPEGFNYCERGRVRAALLHTLPRRCWMHENAHLSH